MKMSKVKQCSVEDCAYNRDSKCHALAITIGHIPDHPQCDTFCSSEQKGGDTSAMAGVGACKATACQYNQSMECSASDISVGMQGSEPDCMSFKRR